jgi:hypothetical protein
MVQWNVSGAMVMRIVDGKVTVAGLMREGSIK